MRRGSTGGQELGDLLRKWWPVRCSQHSKYGTHNTRCQQTIVPMIERRRTSSVWDIRSSWIGMKLLGTLCSPHHAYLRLAATLLGIMESTCHTTRTACPQDTRLPRSRIARSFQRQAQIQAALVRIRSLMRGMEARQQLAPTRRVRCDVLANQNFAASRRQVVALWRTAFCSDTPF